MIAAIALERSIINVAAVPSAHVHGPLCNDCAFYKAPGWCAVGASFAVRCVDKRGAGGKCGPAAIHFRQRLLGPSKMTELYTTVRRLVGAGTSRDDICIKTGLTLPALEMIADQLGLDLPQDETQEAPANEGHIEQEAGPEEPEPAAVGNPASTNSDTGEQPESGDLDNATPADAEQGRSSAMAPRPRGVEACEPQRAVPAPRVRQARAAPLPAERADHQRLPNAVSADVNQRGKIIMLALTCVTQTDADRLFAFLERRQLEGTLLDLLEDA